MYIILVYDIGENRVGKILTICRKYLFWVQKSVFEGELEESKYIQLKNELNENIDANEDTIVIYRFKYKPKYILEKEHLGLWTNTGELTVV